MHTTGNVLTKCNGCDDLQPRVARYRVIYPDDRRGLMRWASLCEACASDVVDGRADGMPTLQTLQEAAEDAFWAAVTGAYPNAASGDLSPATTHALALAMEDAIAEWVSLNTQEEG